MTNEILDQIINTSKYIGEHFTIEYKNGLYWVISNDSLPSSWYATTLPEAIKYFEYWTNEVYYSHYQI